MYCRDFVKRLHAQFDEDGMGLVIEFFISFSRFECALKQSGTYAKPMSRNDNTAQANWDLFAINIAPHFIPPDPSALKNAVDYILGNPPQVQTVDAAGNLTWQPKLSRKPTDAQKLDVYIRRIRNNLFHGGKFHGQMIPDVSRNHQLLSSAIIIFDEWLRLSPLVLQRFEDPLPA